jgi:hypothetical protein
MLAHMAHGISKVSASTLKKKVSDFPVPSWTVTNQALPDRGDILVGDKSIRPPFFSPTWEITIAYVFLKK